LLKPIPFANSLTTVLTIAFITCGIISIILPDLFWAVLNILFHAVNLEIAKSNAQVSPFNLLIGSIIFGAYIWIISYLTISLYNKLSK
jgi:uncharacterized protein YqhQ